MAVGSLIPAAEALEIVLRDVEPVGHEDIDLRSASGRVVSKDLPALRTQPPFNASAMDGYAVRQDDIRSLPTSLKVIGQSRAGQPFTGDVGSGEAVRIFTGAVVPPSADSIVIQENTEAGSDGSVLILKGVEAGKYIRPAGLDFQEADILIRKQDVLTPSKLALAASMNYPTIPVYKKPLVALVSTGDELVWPGQQTADGQIIASNTFGLMASLENVGADVLDCGIVTDNETALKNTFIRALEAGADLILTTGGASVGDHDLVLPVATSIGFEFEISKIAMRPGKPFLFGRREFDSQRVYFTGLAGNPVSSMVGFNVFVRPLIQKLAGIPPTEAQMGEASLGCDLQENDERAEFMRASLHRDKEGKLVATPFAKQDSSMLRLLAEADCLIYREVKAPAAKVGDTVQIVKIAGSNVL